MSAGASKDILAYPKVPYIPFWRLYGKPFVTVTPNGPDDGGDFGPNTPGTQTAGIQEAINFLSSQMVSNGGYTFPLGGTVFIKRGIYILNAGIDLSKAQQINLIGEGVTYQGGSVTQGAQVNTLGATVLQFASTVPAGTSMFYNSNTVNGANNYLCTLVIRDMQLIGTSSTNCIDFSFLSLGNPGLAGLYNVSIQGFNKGIFQQQTAANSGVNVNISHVSFYGCTYGFGDPNQYTLATQQFPHSIRDVFFFGDTHAISVNLLQMTFLSAQVFGGDVVIRNIINSKVELLILNVGSAKAFTTTNSAGAGGSIVNSEVSLMFNSCGSSSSGVHLADIEGNIECSKIKIYTYNTAAPPSGSTTVLLYLYANLVGSAVELYSYESSAGLQPIQWAGGALYYSQIIGGIYNSSPWTSTSIPNNLTLKNFIVNVRGINPVGFITAPAVPASGTTNTVANPYPYPVEVFINGAVTGIYITPAGKTQTQVFGSVSNATVRLNPGDAIALTYTTAPTWTWYGL